MRRSNLNEWLRGWPSWSRRFLRLSWLLLLLLWLRLFGLFSRSRCEYFQHVIALFLLLQTFSVQFSLF
jgi:hypothetical protein